MDTTDRDQLRDAIHRTLTQRAGDAPDSRAVARATLVTWHQLAGRLAPVIGERGVHVLFGRALHLASASYPWLTPVSETDVGSGPLATLRTQLEIHDARASADAGHALLVTFTELLATLIGDSLCGLLLSPVWADPDHPAAPEHDHE